MSLKQYQAYQNNAVNTASGEELTLMLYNGCIKFIKQAMKAMEEQNFEAKNTNIQKAQNIIQELMLTLDSNVAIRSEEHTSELQSRGHLVCRLLLETKK